MKFVIPFNEKKDYIILKDGEIIYWQNSYSYYIDEKLNILMLDLRIDKIEMTSYMSEVRKQKKLKFLRETLVKMIVYKREIKIEEVLDKTNKEDLWLYC